MYYTIYTVTNQINGMVYHGKHETTDLNDGYIGTGGAHYQNAIKKYGRDAFTKVIDYYCIDYNTMTALEKHLSIVEDWMNDPMCYNENIGGDGSFRAINERRKTDPEFDRKCYEASATALSKAMKGKPKSERQKALIKQSCEEAEYPDRAGSANPMFNKTHTQKARQLIGDARRGKNHCRWITNGVDNQYILKHLPTPDGWREGRTLKHSSTGNFVKAA